MDPTLEATTARLTEIKWLISELKCEEAMLRARVKRLTASPKKEVPPNPVTPEPPKE